MVKPLQRVADRFRGGQSTLLTGLAAFTKPEIIYLELV
jgi:hypothetical protein